MKLLLDTQIFIWTFTGAKQLTKNLQRYVNDPTNELYLSVAAIWEMQIKESKGGLSIPDTVEEFATDQLLARSVVLLPIEPKHIWKLKELPLHHRDPFDRIMIAQAIVEDLQLVSVDKHFPNYAVKLVN